MKKLSFLEWMKSFRTFEDLKIKGINTTIEDLNIAYNKYLQDPYK